MGYQAGKGLGKFGTGITQPVEESIQKGRRGLGYMLEGLEKEEVQWELEEVGQISADGTCTGQWVGQTIVYLMQCPLNLSFQIP